MASTAKAVRGEGPSPSLETWALEEVPAERRHGRPQDAGWLWFAANLGLPPWSLGVLALALGLSPWQAVLAVLVANVVGALLLSWVSALGPEAGIPAIALGRRTLGPVFNRIPSLLNAVSCLGWYAVNAVLGGEALARLTHLPLPLSLAVLTAGIALTAMYGHDAVHRAERWIGYALGALFLLSGVRLALGGPSAHGALAHTAGGVGTFLLVVAIVASYLFSWAPYATDYTRYLPHRFPRGEVARSTFWGSLVATAGVELLGVWTGVVAGVAGSPVDVLTRAMGPWAPLALAAVVLGTVTANSLNVYTGSMSSLSVGLPLSRPWAAVAFGLLGGAAAYVGASGFNVGYENFLLLLSYWVAPWIGLTLAWAWHHRPQERLPGTARGVQPWLFLSFLAGLVATVPFMNQALYEGPVARLMGGGDVGYWVGLVVAFAFARLVLVRATRPT
jgi:NCS1 family nucleobase:cation symporter-1